MSLERIQAQVVTLISQHENKDYLANIEQIESLLATPEARKYLNDNPQHLQDIQKIYGKSIEAISVDLYELNRAVFSQLSDNDISNLKNALGPQDNLHNAIKVKVITDIYNETNPELRAIKAERWIAVIQHSFEKGDFSSAIAILATLKFDPHAAEMKTLVSKQSQDIFNAMDLALKVSASQASVNERRTKSGQTFIPYLPTYDGVITLHRDNKNSKGVETLQSELKSLRDNAKNSANNLQATSTFVTEIKNTDSSKAEQRPKVNLLNVVNAQPLLPNMTLTSPSPNVVKEIKFQHERIASRTFVESLQFSEKDLIKFEKSLSKSDKALSMAVTAVKELYKAYAQNKISADQAQKSLNEISSSYERKIGQRNIFKDIRNSILGDKEAMFLVITKKFAADFSNLAKLEQTKSTTKDTGKTNKGNSVNIYTVLSGTQTNAARTIATNQQEAKAEATARATATMPTHTPTTPSINENPTPPLKPVTEPVFVGRKNH